MQVPNEVWSLSKLVHLDVGENQLTGIDDIAEKQPGLQYLDVRDNPLGTFSPAIGKLTQLETLYAYKCQVCQQDHSQSFPCEIGPSLLPYGNCPEG